MQDEKQDPVHRRRVYLELTYTAEDFAFDEYLGYSRISIRSGGQSDRVGWPGLPFDVHHLALPSDATDVRVAVEDESWGRLPGHFSLYPVQPPRLAQSDGQGKQRSGRESPGPGSHHPPLPEGLFHSEMLTRQPDVVGMDPGVAQAKVVQLDLAALGSVSHAAGTAIAAIRIAPIRYAPQRGSVTYLKRGRLVATFRASQATVAGAKYTSPVTAGFDLARIMSTVENPSDLRFEIKRGDGFNPALPDISTDRPHRTLPRTDRSATYPVSSGGRVFVPPGVLLVTEEPDWPYVIITDDFRWAEGGTKGDAAGDLIDQFERLAQWKTRKGVKARVVSVTDIVANRFGKHWQPGTTRDIPEAIRNFLKFAFRRWNTRWCLLGGDIDVVPTRHVLGDLGGWIAMTGEVSPPAGQARHVPGSDELRYHTDFQLTPDDILFAAETGDVVRHRPSADPSNPGWFFTAEDYVTASSVPTRFVVARGPAVLLDRSFVMPQYINMMPTDLYYGSVDSPLYNEPGRHDWDLDGNGVYGWCDYGNPDGVDLMPDISVGRAPVRDGGQARVFVDKVLTYELFRDVRTGRPLDADYPRRVTAVADTWGSGWWDGSLQKSRLAPLDGACQDKETVIARLRDAAGVDRVRRLQADIVFVPRIESNLSVLDSAHISDLRTAVDQGPHFVTVSGHGWYMGCAGFAASDPRWCDVPSMANWPHMGIYFVDSCLTSEFDLDLWTAYNRDGGAQAGDPTQVCFGKAVVRHSMGGAIANVGYCRVGLVNQSQEMPFWETLGIFRQEHVGRMLDRARAIGKDRVRTWQIYDMNLMGDPELPVWTDTPSVFSISHAGHVYGRDRLTVSVFYEEAPVIDARICVCQIGSDPTDKVLFPLVEADEGHYTFDTSTARDGTISTVVTAHNFVPYVGLTEKVSEPVSPKKLRTRGFVYDIVQRTGNSIYAASHDGTLYALTASLAHVWSQELGAPIVDLDRAADGSVTAGLRTASGPNLRLLSSSGSALRSWSTGRPIDSVAQDPVHTAVYAGGEGGVHCYDTLLGGPRWARAMDKCGWVATDGTGNVYAAGWDPGGASRMHKLRPEDGSIIWSYTLGPDWTFYPRSLLVTPDGTAFVGTANHELHKVTALGVQAWRKVRGAPDNLASATVSLAMHGSRLLAGLGDGKLLCMAPDGSIEWMRDVGGRVEAITTSTATDIIYVGCWHGVVSLDGDGGELWSRETTGAVLSLAVRGGRLYAGSRDGWIYQVDIPAATIPVPRPPSLPAGLATIVRRPPELELPELLALLENRAAEPPLPSSGKLTPIAGPPDGQSIVAATKG